MLFTQQPSSDSDHVLNGKIGKGLAADVELTTETSAIQGFHV